MKMKCPKCQFENREGIKFCEKCGAKLELVCPNCRANIPLDREFCGECGHNLATPSPTQAPPVELSFEEKLENIQRYLPGGLTEKILAQRGKIEGERKQVTVLLCNTEGFSTLYERLSAFVVDMHSAGVSVGELEETMGVKGQEICDIVLDNVRVSKGNLIGDQNTGFAVATQNLGGGRIVVGATGVGIAQAAFEESVKYAKQRKQFGKEIGKEIDQFEVIQFYLADMAILIGAARNLNYHAASLKDVDLPHTIESAVAKCFGTEAAVDVTRKAVQIHGGFGYTKQAKVERLYRDAKVTEIYEGANEIQRIIIAWDVLGKEWVSV